MGDRYRDAGDGRPFSGNANQNLADHSRFLIIVLSLPCIKLYIFASALGVRDVVFHRW